MEYQKGPDMLVDAMPMVVANKWDARFIMAGEGSMKHQLEEQARRMGLPVKFLGYIPDSEYVRLLHASDVIVIPSRNEPFGLVLLEAWSAKRPVVACDVGGWPRISRISSTASRCTRIRNRSPGALIIY